MDEERMEPTPELPLEESAESNAEEFDGAIDDIPAETADEEAFRMEDEPPAEDELPPEDEIPEFSDGDEGEFAAEETAILRRTPRKPRPTSHKVLRGLLIAGKWALAVVLVLAILAGGGIGYLTLTEYTPAYAEAAQYGAFNTDKKLT